MILKSESVVAVLIPTFQRSALLLRAIRSAQTQSYPDLLICVYDNASTDATEHLVRELCANDPRIRYHRHDENIGAIANYSYALEKVSTPFFAFLADDDVLYPDCIRQAINGLNANTDVVFWGGNTLHVSADTGAVIRGTGWSWVRGGVYSSSEACRRICSGNHLEFQGLVFRTAMVRERGVNFTEEIALPDVDFQLRLASHYRVGATRDVTAAMFSHNQSISSGMRSFSTFWPTMKYVGHMFIDYTSLSSTDAQRCVKEWERTTILTLLFLAGSWRGSVNSQRRPNIIRILREDYPNYWLARVGQRIIGLYVLPFPIPFLAWLAFKLIYITIRPSVFFDRVLPYCLSTFRKPPPILHISDSSKLVAYRNNN